MCQSTYLSNGTPLHRSPARKGDVTIVPILEEVLVVEKRLLLKEELRITRHRTTNVTEVAVPLRKQRAEIERLKDESK